MNDIEVKIDDLFNYFEKSKLYKDYIKIKKQLENDKDIMEIIKKIKRYQKIVANNNDKVLEKEINKMYLKLGSYPVYQSYLIIKEELNQEIFMVKEIFEKYFEELLKLK